MVLFNDKSGSMRGKPFDTLKKSYKNIADIIFDEKDETLFEKVQLVFYNHDLFPCETKGKQEIEKFVA